MLACFGWKNGGIRFLTFCVGWKRQQMFDFGLFFSTLPQSPPHSPSLQPSGSVCGLLPLLIPKWANGNFLKPKFSFGICSREPSIFLCFVVINPRLAWWFSTRLFIFLGISFLVRCDRFFFLGADVSLLLPLHQSLLNLSEAWTGDSHLRWLRAPTHFFLLPICVHDLRSKWHKWPFFFRVLNPLYHL